MCVEAYVSRKPLSFGNFHLDRTGCWMSSSRIPGFYNLPLPERLAELARAAGLPVQDLAAFNPETGLELEQADHMIENVVGAHALPLGIALGYWRKGAFLIIHLFNIGRAIPSLGLILLCIILLFIEG